MTMEIRRYEAIDMNEAVRMIKEDLGSNAIILSTRTVSRGSGSFGLFGRKVVEVTASPGKKNEPAPRRFRRPNNPAVSVSSPETTFDAARSMAPVIEAFDEIKEKLGSLASAPRKEIDEATSERLADEVREMKSMLSYLLDQSQIEKEKGMPRTFLALRRILEERHIAPEYIETIIGELRAGSEDNEPDLKTLINLTARRMRDVLMFGGEMNHPGLTPGQTRVVAFCGPTGVGKTTTVAKLAARLVERGASVALVTIDTYRIAAVEQLKIYAKLLNVPLEVALQPADLGRFIHMHKRKDFILIDTAGRSQRDINQITELKRFLGADTTVETKLVLSVVASEEQNGEAIKNFGALNVDSLIFTKLDEATSLGPVFNQLARTGLPASYFTIGQQVPEDIEEATGKRLINAIFKAKSACFVN